jgi:hypothetical protein
MTLSRNRRGQSIQILQRAIGDGGASSTHARFPFCSPHLAVAKSAAAVYQK